MSFEDLPKLPPLIHPEANGYAERGMAATRLVQKRERVVIDLKYGADYWQKVDVYLPSAEPAQGLPSLVFFHGGAWTNGTKEWMGFMAPPLLTVPAIYVAVNYRLAPHVRHPAQAEDCLAAISWVHRNIARYGGDPDRLMIGGHSAGAHLAALACVDAARQAAQGLPDGAIKACLAISGSYDMRNRSAPPGSSGRRIYDMVLAREEDDADASPIAFVRSGLPPFFLAWGENDFPHLREQGKAMAAALSQAGGRVVTMQIPGVDHFGANEVCGDARSEWVAQARQWLAGNPGN